MRFFYRQACFLMLVLAYGRPASAQTSFNDNTLIYSTDGTNATPDTNQQYVIRNIAISGNSKTKPNIILREIAFEIDEAYSLDEIVKRFERARKQLMNTGLF